MKKQCAEAQFVVCIKNSHYRMSLELRKIYRVLPDLKAGKKLVRVLDESGEDYLYPSDYFVPIEIPEAVEKTFSLVA